MTDEQITPELEVGITLSAETIAEAATNEPSLSPDEFLLGEKTYKVVHLSYDDYVAFIAYIQPFFDAIVGKLGDKIGASIPGINIGKSLDASVILKFCGNSLPEMTRLVIKQTVPSITVDQIKHTPGVTPFTLATIVMQQVIKNNMVKDFATFFVQMAPLFRVK